MEFYWGKGGKRNDKFVTPAISCYGNDEVYEIALWWWDFYISVAFVKGK